MWDKLSPISKAAWKLFNMLRSSRPIVAGVDAIFYNAIPKTEIESLLRMLGEPLDSWDRLIIRIIKLDEVELPMINSRKSWQESSPSS